MTYAETSSYKRCSLPTCGAADVRRLRVPLLEDLRVVGQIREDHLKLGGRILERLLNTNAVLAALGGSCENNTQYMQKLPTENTSPYFGMLTSKTFAIENPLCVLCVPPHFV